MNSWGMGWLLGWVLLALGILAALVAGVLAAVGAMGADAIQAVAYREGATPLALVGLALIVAGGALRWCGGCYDQDCCDWDDERPNATLTTSKSA
jgi:hypothetical protein